MNSLTIKTFPLGNASMHEYRAIAALDNLIRREKLPDDPPIPLEEQIRRLQNIPAFVEKNLWGVWDARQTALVALGTVNTLLTDENKHLAEFNIEVLPDFRRRGIARDLLGRIAATARANERTTLIAQTTERVPAGEAFMERLHAQKGLAAHINQLDLRELPRNLLLAWQARAAERAADFELGLWEGEYPEEDIQSIAALYQVMNSAPRGTLAIEDFEFTPARVREMERPILARGAQRWALYAREKSTGKFVGITEVFWHAYRPQLLEQGKTGVMPEYRNRGLGRWLKAAMLDKVLRERPEVRFVRTGNADSNAAMLKINFELGFKHYVSQTIWQLELSQLHEYLSQNERMAT